MESKDSVVWITGASGGFGRELALRCARVGAKLALTSRSAAALEDLAAECEKAGSPKSIAKPADVRDPAAVAQIAGDLHRAFGRIDGLVTSAGDVPLGDIESTTDEQWMYGIQNKLLATVYCMRAALPIMREQKRGRVVVLSGSRGMEPTPKSVLTGSINAALNNIVKGVSRDFVRYGVAVNAVAPALVMTARGELFVQTESRKTGRSAADVKADWTRELPAGRFVTADEIVTVLFDLLFSFPDAFTGQTVFVDGGESYGVR
jgi:NAD(P)-dependent dehydrogenase (short-subunit alcohol dehydrogenase family)